MSAHSPPPVSFVLRPPGEGGAERRMGVRPGANVTLARNPYPHPCPSPDGRGVHIEPTYASVQP